jgi:hypothetical protein
MQTLEQFLDQLEQDTTPAQGSIGGARSYLCGVKGPSPMLDNNDYECFHEIKAESAEDALAKLTAMMSEEAHSPRVIREIEPDSSIFDIIEDE